MRERRTPKRTGCAKQGPAVMAWIAQLGSAMSLGMRMKETSVTGNCEGCVLFSSAACVAKAPLPNILFVVGIVRGHLADILTLG